MSWRALGGVITRDVNKYLIGDTSGLRTDWCADAPSRGMITRGYNKRFRTDGCADAPSGRVITSDDSKYLVGDTSDVC